ncbi:class II fructose-bisphosphate aldolase [Oscillospiraceae bacterium MB08-C2-2]|nr:class II fructose-bisphosphate aldolase [Oscillospiraceae bacterium MB08-C2-2]
MYVPMKVFLDDASKNYYGVPAINVVSMELARGVINAAIAENAPLILNIGEGQMSGHGHANIMAPMIKSLAENAPVPIALNLDHGKTWERITHTFRWGFSSIMIDASVYDLEENIARTKRVVDLCHPQGVSVEGEIGHVGQAADGDGQTADLFTKPADAVYFKEKTGVDALAVAVGSAHGKYPDGFVPTLHFDLIREIKEATGHMPLVLHGGSGSGDENMTKAVEAGINKVNICTDIWTAGRDYMVKTLAANPKTDLMPLLQGYENAIKESAQHFMRVLKTSGKGSNFTWESCREKDKEIIYDKTGE